ncbi:hypothetical protein NDU88_004668 [Pleurodeles waltl]|uniref:Uncharacterized protein n=1 Tax=Pleurodeles waltl TaxID=8319 RepID=A0AAV7NK87_PLEWA|nr:hypothetical protein NDU88_004668 [Pleurodeles waltl]
MAAILMLHNCSKNSLVKNRTRGGGGTQAAEQKQAGRLRVSGRLQEEQSGTDMKCSEKTSRGAAGRTLAPFSCSRKCKAAAAMTRKRCHESPWGAAGRAVALFSHSRKSKAEAAVVARQCSENDAASHCGMDALPFLPLLLLARGESGSLWRRERQQERWSYRGLFPPWLPRQKIAKTVPRERLLPGPSSCGAGDRTNEHTPPLRLGCPKCQN